MEECDHCSESFEDEDAYLEHLAAEHREELGRIEQRRVEEYEGEQSGGSRTGLYVSVAAVAIIAALGAFALGNVFGSSTPTPMQDDVREPNGLRTVHEHGTMNVTVDGQEIDFSQREYQVQDDYFHFENGDGTEYHLHGRGITLEYALETLDIGVTNTALSYEGTVYNDTNPNERVVYRVNGEAVNPEQYVLQEGDQVEVIAEETG